MCGRHSGSWSWWRWRWWVVTWWGALLALASPPTLSAELESSKASPTELRQASLRLVTSSASLLQRLTERGAQLELSQSQIASLERQVSEQTIELERLRSGIESWRRQSGQSAALSELLQQELEATSSSLQQSETTLSSSRRALVDFKDLAGKQITGLEAKVKTWRLVAILGPPAGVLLGLLLGVLASR